MRNGAARGFSVRWAASDVLFQCLPPAGETAANGYHYRLTTSTVYANVSTHMGGTRAGNTPLSSFYFINLIDLYSLTHDDHEKKT
jgi:hypothetical protein